MRLKIQQPFSNAQAMPLADQLLYMGLLYDVKGRCRRSGGQPERSRHIRLDGFRELGSKEMAAASTT